jgi:predicted adenylyl cyclase CyaB
MARNIELKCRCAHLDAVRQRALTLGAEDRGMLVQRDTFFTAPYTRLKLRDFGDGRAELISYRRSDVADARASEYHIAPASPQLAVVLADALGTTGIVEKRRHLWMWRHTRIHLDDVTGLGTFVELETVIRAQSEGQAHAELAHVADALALDRSQLVPIPYVELLARNGRAT